MNFYEPCNEEKMKNKIRKYFFKKKCVKMDA